MIRKGLDLLEGAELYRRYNMWQETEGSRKGSEYLFNSEDRLDNLIDYYSDEKLYINDIGELSNMFTYKFGITNRVDEDRLVFGVLEYGYEHGLDGIEAFAERLCELAMEVDGVFEGCSYDILDECDNTYVVLIME